MTLNTYLILQIYLIYPDHLNPKANQQITHTSKNQPDKRMSKTPTLIILSSEQRNFLLLQPIFSF